MNELEKKIHGFKNKNWIFWLPLVISVLYQSYRYPLQINASGTSPTYSDTPLALQVGKFILVLPFFALATVSCLHKALTLKQWGVVLAVQFLFIFALFKTITTGAPTYLEASFWMEASLMLACASEVISLKAINRFLLFLLFYALGSNLIEVLLFIFSGRLPALAYENSLSVRFGGFLDDPNGFAALLFLLMGWSYQRFKGKTRAGVLAALLVSLCLTQSWTAIVFFALLIVFWMLVAFPRRPVRLGIIFGVCALTILFIVQNTPDSALALVQAVLEDKQGSADQHRFPWSEYAPKWSEWIIQGSSEWSAYEFWWAEALINFGAPWLFIAFCLIVFSVQSLKTAYARTSVEGRPIYLGLSIFGAYFLIGSFNLPLPLVFPINIVFFMFSFLVIFGKTAPFVSKREPSLMP